MRLREENTNPVLAIPASNLRSRVLKNAFVLFAGQAALILSSAITTFALARQLGAEEFGQYNAIVAFVGLFLPFATFGLDSVLVREIAQHRARGPAIFGSGLILRFLASLVAIL